MKLVQYRMARAALNWTSSRVATAAEVTIGTIAALESGNIVSSRAMTQIQAALEAEGVVFIADDGRSIGVRLKHAEQSESANHHPKLSRPLTSKRI